MAKPWYRQLHWQILFAMVVGVVVGSIGGERSAEHFGWLGTLFVKLLKMMIIPLVATSIISGVASIGSSGALGKMFGKTLGYYLLSSGLAAIVGLFIVNLIRPGVGADLVGVETAQLPDLAAPKSPVELLLDIVPENVVAAAAKPNMLAVIFFCIVVGMTISQLDSRNHLLLKEFIEAAFETMMKLTAAVIKFAPIGVFGLMVAVIGESGLAAFRSLSLYMLTIALGLTVHLFVVLPLLLFGLGRINPWIHFRNMSEALVMAFSTSSSLATLPVTLRSVERRAGVSNKTSSFVLPMGATVNMDGTALYECAGVLFIAQVLGADLSLGSQVVVVLTAMLASIGAAAVPSAGLVIIFLVLESVNLRGPQVDMLVGAMLAIDRPLDMYRTVINIYGDSCGAAIIARSEGEASVDTRIVR